MLILQGEPSRCGFLRRWWHGRLRAADVEMMLHGIRMSARTRRASDDKSWQDICWDMWQFFMLGRGQEHWHCACGIAHRLDRTEVCVERIRELAKRVR